MNDNILSYTLWIAVTVLIVCLTYDIYLRIKLKAAIKSDSAILFKDIYRDSIFDNSATLRWLNFIWHKKQWQRVKNKEILSLVSKLRIIEIIYYVAFFSIILAMLGYLNK